MQLNEFNVFIEKLFAAFPSLHEWVSNSEKVKDPLATKAVWFKTLETISYTEAMSVLDRWTTGALKAFSAFERDLVATSIRCIVEQDRSRENKRCVESKQEFEDAQKYRKDYSPIAPVLAKALQLRRNGVEVDVRKCILESFPASAPYDGPRYKCFICCDRGRVEVWDNDLARAIDQGVRKLETSIGKTYVVACGCDAGTPYTQWKRPLPRYQPDQHCRWHNQTIEEERARLAKWLAERKKHVEFAAWEA